VTAQLFATLDLKLQLPLQAHIFLANMALLELKVLSLFELFPLCSG
jgi:hypothetical protein